MKPEKKKMKNKKKKMEEPVSFTAADTCASVSNCVQLCPSFNTFVATKYLSYQETRKPRSCTSTCQGKVITSSAACVLPSRHHRLFVSPSSHSLHHHPPAFTHPMQSHHGTRAGMKSDVLFHVKHESGSDDERLQRLILIVCLTRRVYV